MPSPEAEIAARINEWAFYRDQEGWEGLLSTFHEGGAISISWYDGPCEGFVAASKQLAAGGKALVKHRLGVPKIRVRSDRALSEVDVTIMVRARTPSVEVDTTSYARFYDRLERRGGVWKIGIRTAIYEKDRADPVSAPSLPAAFFEGLERFPAEVRFLAVSLERVGAKLSESLVLDKSERLAELYREGEAWLAGDGS
jgi:SnoaL-like domain